MATGQHHAGRRLGTRHREAAARYSQPRGQRRDPGVGRYFQETRRHSPDGCTAYGVTFHDAAYHAVALASGVYLSRRTNDTCVSPFRLCRIG